MINVKREKISFFILLLMTLFFSILGIAACNNQSSDIDISNQNSQYDSGTSAEDNKNSDSQTEEKVYVTVSFVADNNALIGDASFRVEKGKNLTVEISIKEGYEIRENKEAKYMSIGTVNKVYFFLENVRYDERIELRTKPSYSTIKYMLNGGSFILGDIQNDSFTESGSTSKHLRKNTNIGTNTLNRAGYTQTGWNTQADGSGEHIGLGSRVTVKNGEVLTLYAEWEKWEDVSNFNYIINTQTEEEGDIVITSYKSMQSVEKLVIPAEIEGQKVTALLDSCVYGVNIQKLILPASIQTIENNAFNACNITEVYMYDNVQKIEDSSFGIGVKTLHINAISAPTYSNSFNAQFVESMDRLIFNKEKKKMILYGGCSMTFGIRSDLVEDAFNGEYVVIDLGIHGETNATFQMECIAEYLKPGDVFVHAPETMNPFQFTLDVSANYILYSMIESNYDLLALADAQKIEGLLSAFASFNQTRAFMEALTYEDRSDSFNEHGDMCEPIPDNAEDTNFNADGSMWFYPSEYVTESNLQTLNGLYKQIAEKGAKILFSYGPINDNAITQPEKAYSSWTKYDSAIAISLNRNYVTIISKAGDYIYEGKYFYDTDYHLTDNGKVLRAEQLIKDIKNALQ